MKNGVNLDTGAQIRRNPAAFALQSPFPFGRMCVVGIQVKIRDVTRVMTDSEGSTLNIVPLS